MCVVSGGVSRYLAVVTALEAPGPLFNLPSGSVFLWLLQPPLCLEGTDVPLPVVPSHADLLLAVVLLSHEILAAVSSCFVAHFCKSRLMGSVPSTTDEETSAPLTLCHLLFGLSLEGCQGLAVPSISALLLVPRCSFSRQGLLAGCWKRLKRDGVS